MRFGILGGLRRRRETRGLRRELAEVDAELMRAVTAHEQDLAQVHPAHRLDAVNLVQYVALRQLDVRGLQRRLAEQGLSSLGRCEPHVLATLRAARGALERHRGRLPAGVPTFAQGRGALDRNTDELLGPRPPGRVPRIMVTLPSEAAGDPALVRRMVERGMDLARINAAHDDLDHWVRMADNVRSAAAATGRPCRVSIDLPGPKLRTGALEDGPAVLAARPVRDLRGCAVFPARVTLVATEPTPVASDPDAGTVPVAGSWLARRRVGDVVTFRDTRGSRRELVIMAAGGGRSQAELWDTAFIETGMALDCDGDPTTVGPLPPREQYHVLRVGDLLEVTGAVGPQPPWRPDLPGQARIGCEPADALRAVRVGERILLDDGRFAGVAESVGADSVRLRLTSAPPRGGRLRAARGINLPDSDLQLPILEPADERLVDLAARQADLLALSFVRHESDIERCQEAIAGHDAGDLGLILKIETAKAFEHLPAILLQAMRSHRVGVMIARGDLAVETGYERLSELQEEILWLCEAAHVPVIWATEVLDRLAQTGQPTRAEVTDAAMAQRAEAVMLNKGPYIDTAITTLDDILRRMAGHQRKKTALLRPLRSWTPAPRVPAGGAASVKTRGRRGRPAPARPRRHPARMTARIDVEDEGGGPGPD